MSHPDSSSDASPAIPRPGFRFTHVLLGAAAGFITITILVVGLLLLGGDDFATANWLRMLSRTTALALVTGLCLAPFQRIRWYWAIAVGALIAICFTFATVFAFGFFGLD